MEIKRCAYIVDFKGKEVPKKLSKLDVNLAYVSKKSNYAVVYLDENKGEKMLLSQLHNVKGFVALYPSLFFHIESNIEVQTDWCQEKILDSIIIYDTID